MILQRACWIMLPKSYASAQGLPLVSITWLHNWRPWFLHWCNSNLDLGYTSLSPPTLSSKLLRLAGYHMVPCHHVMWHPIMEVGQQVWHSIVEKVHAIHWRLPVEWAAAWPTTSRSNTCCMYLANRCYGHCVGCHDYTTCDCVSCFLADCKCVMGWSA